MVPQFGLIPVSYWFIWFIEGSLEVKLPTIWTDEKQSREEAERRERLEERRVRRKKMQIREKVGKLRNNVFFHWFVAPEGRKVGSLKRSQLARWKMKNCTPLWREAHFQVKRCKTNQVRTTFGSWDVEKVHAVVARSTFPSQNVQNTPGPDHFWQLRCRKSACRCGAKHISKSKWTKNTIVGPLLAVEMSKKCTPLWREAHFQVKMDKAHHCGTTFGSWDVEKVHAVVARSTFRSQNGQNTPLSDHFWQLRCRKSARRCGAKHISKSKWTKHTIVGTLLAVEMSKKCTALWREAHFQVKIYKTLGVRITFGGWDVEKVHAVVARSTFPSQHVKNTRVWTAFGGWDVGKVHAVVARSTCRSQNVQNTRGSDHFWRFRCRFASLHYTTWHYTTLHYTRLHYTTLHNATTTTTQLHSTTLHYTKLHYTTLQYITLRSTTVHYATVH